MNSLKYDKLNNTYIFGYQSGDFELLYHYSLNKGGSFNAITLEINGYSFLPSNFGGIGISTKQGLFYPWSEEIKYNLIDSKTDGDTLITEWEIFRSNEFYYVYRMKICIIEKSLIINLKDIGPKDDITGFKEYAEINAVYLDRCENTKDPVMIGVPYLTMFNILYNNNIFTSFFFDWTKTNCSVLKPYDQLFSKTSLYYGQYALYNKLTNNTRNKLDETIYLTASYDIDDVLPNIPNPVSHYRNESINHIIFDYWPRFDKCINDIQKIHDYGINDIWLIVHDWQHAGYDKQMPDYLPARDLYGGNSELLKLSELTRSFNYLFSLHENYIGADTDVPSGLNFNDIILLPNGKRSFFDSLNNFAGYHFKPTKYKDYLIPRATEIHNTFMTNACYLDVHSSYDPSIFVDYDYKSDGAGKFLKTYQCDMELGKLLENINAGPVSGEGLAHFLYVGYYDDFEAQIHTAKSLPGNWYANNTFSETEGGFYKPLLVNFDVEKMQEKTFSHGLGYYERFFYKNNYWQYMGRSRDSALMYTATELAYGHGAFFSSESYNFVEDGNIEYKYVYPIQLLYSNTKVSKILYNDDGNLLTASEYIRKYPNNFDKFEDDNFMSQVYIEYENGLQIFVNRNTTKKWTVNFQGKYGFYSTHSFFDGKDSLFVGNMTGKKFILPENNGWLCYYQK